MKGGGQGGALCEFQREMEVYFSGFLFGGPECSRLCERQPNPYETRRVKKYDGREIYPAYNADNIYII